MNFKKTLSLAIAAVMSVSLLASCGGGKDGDGNTTVLTIWTANAHSKNAYNEAIAEWNKNEGKKMGVKLVYEVKEGDLTQQIDLAIQTGEAPDLFSGNVEKLAADGYIMAINDLPGGEEFVKERYDRVGKDYKAEGYLGKNYYIPMAATTMGLVYNVEMFKAAGIVDENGNATPPETYAQMRDYAKRLTNESKREYGIALPMKWGGWFGDISNALMAEVGHAGYDPVKDEYDYTGLAPVMNAYLDIKNDGSYYPGAESLDNDPARARFSEGGIGMKIAYSFDVGVLTEQFPAKIEWAVAPMPVMDTDNMYKQYQKITGSLVINSKITEKISPEQVMEIYKFICGDPMVKKLYAAGCEVPFDWSIVEGVELEKDIPGWAEFCAMQSISSSVPNARKVEISGERDLKSDFLEKVWAGEMTAEEACANYTKVMNAGVKKYQELHPEYDGDKCVNKNWDTTRTNWMFE